MSYFDISFQKDLFRELLIGFDSLNDLYQVFPTSLCKLSGPCGRLLQDGQFYADKIKDNYGLRKTPKIPFSIFYNGYHTYYNEKELARCFQYMLKWPPRNKKLAFVSDIGSLAFVKFLIGKGVDVNFDHDLTLRNTAGSGHVDVVKFLGGAYSYVLRLMQWLVK